MPEKKFIPDADSDFACMARVFETNIAEDPSRFRLSADESAHIRDIVQVFRDALALAIQPNTRTKIAIMRKDAARAKAERVVRKYANAIRVNEDISHVDKQMIMVRERPRRLKRRTCPLQPPYLRYVGSAPAPGRPETPGIHILEFREAFEARSKAKPFGAVRLELFVELIPPGVAVPKSPGQCSGGRPWYLRSFTTNPIRVEFPDPGIVAGGPMLVVYWGRWADAKGNVGRWSHTVQARVEGWPAVGIAPEITPENNRDEQPIGSEQLVLG